MTDFWEVFSKECASNEDKTKKKKKTEGSKETTTSKAGAPEKTSVDEKRLFSALQRIRRQQRETTSALCRLYSEVLKEKKKKTKKEAHQKEKRKEKQGSRTPVSAESIPESSPPACKHRASPDGEQVLGVPTDSGAPPLAPTLFQPSWMTESKPHEPGDSPTVNNSPEQHPPTPDISESEYRTYGSSSLCSDAGEVCDPSPARSQAASPFASPEAPAPPPSSAGSASPDGTKATGANRGVPRARPPRPAAAAAAAADPERRPRVRRRTRVPCFLGSCTGLTHYWDLPRHIGRCHPELKEHRLEESARLRRGHQLRSGSLASSKRLRWECPVAGCSSLVINFARHLQTQHKDLSSEQHEDALRRRQRERPSPAQEQPATRRPWTALETRALLAGAASLQGRYDAAALLADGAVRQRLAHFSPQQIYNRFKYLKKIQRL